MVTFYNANKVNSRHLVLFDPPPRDEKFYFDLDQNKWRKCVVQDRLPYGLLTYKVFDHNDDTEVIVTCPDSYLMSDTENTSKNLFDQKWRKDILTPDSEFDFLYKDEWVQACAADIKSDIVPGVIRVSHRRGWMLGYVYYESSRIAPLFTHTEIITPEQLKHERLQHEKFVDDQKKINDEIEEWKEKLPVYSYKGWIGANYFGCCLELIDIRPYYSSLKKDPIPITMDRIREYQQRIGKPEPEAGSNSFIIGLMGLVSCSLEYDVVCIEHHHSIKNEKFPIYRFGDGIISLIVRNATYAYLELPNDQQKIELVENDNDFILKDIDIDNPLLQSNHGVILNLRTDGDFVEAEYILIRTNKRTVLSKLQGSFAITWLKEKVIILGHMWAPCKICSISDFIKTES